MSDPYRGSHGARPGSQRRGSHDDALDGYLAELSGRGNRGRASVGGARSGGYSDSYSGGRSGGRRGRHSRDDSYDGGYSDRGLAGRASVGRASVGSAASGAAGRASVGRASVGGVRPGGPDGPGGHGGPGRMDRNRRRSSALARRKAARRRKVAAMFAVAVMLAGFLVLAGTYYFVNVPSATELASLKQNSKILYSNGKLLAKVGKENREYVPIEKIPKHVQHAVVGAEDRTFYSNSGIDVKGIMRAAWNNITDDDVEGASTITQQYVRNAADLTRGVSYSRKVKEMMMAVKINQQLSKQEILEYYLNTIYFGRGAYGVEAASQAYFGKSISKLTVAEGALLAGVIKSPEGVFNPDVDPKRAEARWRWVLNNMVQLNWLSKAEANKAKFPKPQAKDKAKGAGYGLNKPEAMVKKYVVQELRELGIDEEQLANNGYTIRTTIDRKMQNAAKAAVNQVMKGQPKKLAEALVAVEPGTGRVLAYYGGKNGSGFDYAGSRHPPGSSFKAYVLATALENNISFDSYWDGSSPQEFPDREKPVRNSENNNQCKNCSLKRATVLSLNTTYYAVTSEVGKEKVIDLAGKAGIRTMKRDSSNEVVNLVDDPGAAAGKFGNEVGIGQYAVSVLDNANGFATFAANGTAAEAHFVDKVVREGEEFAKTRPETTRAFSVETARDATHVLQGVVTSGSNDLGNGRPSAGKTGTWQFQDTPDNAHAWMCGYTPQLAAAVWVGKEGDEGPIRTKDEVKIYGSGLPGQIWKAFMDKALEGKPNKNFLPPVHKGDVSRGNISSPSPPPPSDEPSNEPTVPPGHSGEPSTLPEPTPTETCRWFCGD